ncbi:hypothetical protein ACLOJK_005427 [Asimina triloba]
MFSASEIWSWWLEASSETDRHARFLLAVVVTIFPISWYSWLIHRSRRSSKPQQPPLPPGPPGLPVIGCLPFVEPELHLYFARLQKTYGPIFSLRLGSKLTVVLSSVPLAKAAMKDLDAVFANRDEVITARTLSYGGLDIAWSPYGEDWRIQRRLFVCEMMSHPVLKSFYPLRRQEVRRTVAEVYAKAGTAISIREQMFLTVLNVITNMMWGGTVEGEERATVGAEFRRVVEEAVLLMGEPNVSDVFPFLARFDLQGLDLRMKRLSRWFDQIFDGVVEKRRKMVNAEGERKDRESRDFVQLLMQLMDDEEQKQRFTMKHFRAMLMDIVVGGTETTSVTIEWAMTELMHAPEKLSRVREELDRVVGQSMMVEESHLSELHYLEAVLKEVLRLHPVLPLMIPRSPTQACVVGGYTIPKGARVWVNAWAIQRDPECWDSPLEFRPERFLTNPMSRWDYHHDFRYIPFGSGRRVCAGLPMAEKMLMYVAASLLHSFEWSMPDGVELDLTEKFGITMKKSVPLAAVPTPRLSDPGLYAQHDASSFQ